MKLVSPTGALGLVTALLKQAKKQNTEVTGAATTATNGAPEWGSVASVATTPDAEIESSQDSPAFDMDEGNTATDTLTEPDKSPTAPQKSTFCRVLSGCQEGELENHLSETDIC